MSRAILILALCASALLLGCAGTSETGRDFGEIWRARVGIGLGLRAHAGIGDLLHAGFGYEMSMSGEEYVYGTDEAPLLRSTLNCVGHFEDRTSYAGPPARFNWQIPDCEHCLMLVPVLTNRRVRTWMHRFDLELELHLVVFQVSIGFSPGEFLDFLCSIFGADLDPEVPDPSPFEPGVPGLLMSPD